MFPTEQCFFFFSRNLLFFEARAFRHACLLHPDTRNGKGTRPLEALLSYVGIGRWPILNHTAQFAIYQVLGHVIRELGLDVIVSVRVGLDYYNSDRYLIYIGQPSFGVETAVLRSRYRSPFFSILHRYKLYMYRSALLMGSNVAAADLVNEIVRFEAALATISEPADVVHNPRRVYNLMALRTLEGAIPEVRWTYFLNLILRDVGVSMDLNDHVVVTNPIYLKRLSRLLKHVPSSVVANYVGWRIVQEMGPHAVGRFRQARFRFDRYRYLMKEDVQVPRECVRLSARFLRFAVGRLYFDRRVTKPVRRFKAVHDVAEEVRDAFDVLIDMSDWMNPETKALAREKLHRLQLHIGFPHWIRSDRDLDDYYKDVPDLRKEDFFFSLLITMRIYNRIMLGRLRQLNKASDFGWIPFDPTSTMYYSLVGNYLLLPIEYIQFPFLLYDMPPPVNFGTFGSLVGQQMIYGFGEQGSLYDKYGRLTEWWTRDTRQKFVTAVRCLTEQYYEYTDPVTGLKIDTNSTSETIVADNAGVRLAFKSRCEVTRNRTIYHFLRPREQAPSRLRTMTPLMNFDRFAYAFKCRTGTIMSPERRCLVW
ncbi:neprilysin-1-like [Haemaphysalis longicornis]